MIDLTEDKVRKKIRRALDLTKENPTTDYAERHTHLVSLYLDYLIKTYPPKQKTEAVETADTHSDIIEEHA